MEAKFEIERPVNLKLKLYSDIKTILKATIIQPDLINTVLKYFDVRDLFKHLTFSQI